MDQQEFCQGCNQKNRCQEVYQKLGNVKGPAVMSEVAVAFLLPIVVFIISFAVFKDILARVITVPALQSGLGLLLALSVTIALLAYCSARYKR